jgi:hypothetical protein
MGDPMQEKVLMFEVFIRHRDQVSIAFVYYFLSYSAGWHFCRRACNTEFTASIRLLPDEEDPMNLT